MHTFRVSYQFGLSFTQVDYFVIGGPYDNLFNLDYLKLT